MALVSQDKRGPGKNKRQWTELEDRKLIEAILDLHNTSSYTADGVFKPGFFDAVEKILVVSLPDSGLKAEPHIKSRVKTLKKHFAIVHDMICGPSTSGFRYDEATKYVIAEKPIWNAYIKSQKNAHIFRDKPFPFYSELCIIFGKDRTTSRHRTTRRHAEALADAVAELDREEAIPTHDAKLHNPGDGQDAMEFSMSQEQPPNIDTLDNTSEVSSSKRKRKKGQTLEETISEVMERTTTIMSSTIEKTALILSQAIKDSVHEMKLQLNAELSKLEGLSRMERHRAMIKIGCDRDLTVLFFTLSDDEKEEWVRALLM